MIFWSENNLDVTYNTLLSDINKRTTSIDLEGYNYFRELLTRIFGPTKFDNIDQLINYLNINQSDIEFVIYTSGTTSSPKPIEVKFDVCNRYIKSSKNSNKIWGMGYPCGSYASTQVFFQALMNKESILYLYGQDFKDMGFSLEKHKVTNLNCTPTFLSMLLTSEKNKNTYLKKITTGGEMLSKSIILNYKNIFPNAELINIYATTETGSLLYSKNELFDIPKRYEHLIKIHNNSIHVHYSLLNNFQVENESTWFDTKDKVEFISHNQFRIIGRDSGYLNIGGYRISPFEIEEEILSINGILDVHVYGRSNAVLGTILCADVVSSDEITPKEIKLFLMGKLEKFKIPQKIKIVDTYTKLKNGKKQRKE